MSDLSGLTRSHDPSIEAETAVQKQDASQSGGVLKSLATKVGSITQPILGKLADQLQKGASLVFDNKVVRKLKDVLDFLDKCDFTFVRAKKEPYMKEELNDILQLILKRYQDFEHNQSKMLPDAIIDEVIQLLLEIGALSFSPERYPVRNAIVAELLTKHLVANWTRDDLVIPVPCFNRKGEPVVIEYHLHKRLNLGSTGIPVYLFAAKDNEDKKEFTPLLIFRGTKFGFSKKVDVRSVIENLNKAGPARGVYDDFKNELKKLFAEWKFKINPPLFRILGYSQGAVLGQRAIVDFYNYIEKGVLNSSILFNSPGVETDYIEAWSLLKPEEKPVCVNILVTHDVVSKRGTKFIGDVYEIEPIEKGTLLQAHLGSKFIAPTIEVYEVDNEKESFSEMRKLVNEVMSSNLVESLYKLASYGMTAEAPTKTIHARTKQL